MRPEQFRESLEGGDGARDLDAADHGQGLAGVAHFGIDEGVEPPPDGAGDLQQPVRPLIGRRGRRDTARGAQGGLHRFVHQRGIGLLDLGDQGIGSGVALLEAAQFRT